MRLFLRFTIVLLMSMLVVFTGHSILGIIHQLHEAEESIRVNQAVMGRVLKASVEDTWEAFGETAARDLIKRTNERDSQTDFRFVDVSPGTHPTTWIDRDSFGAGTIYTYVPLVVGDHLAGAIEIKNNLQREKEWLRERIAQNVITSLIILAVCSAIAFVVGARLVARPVSQLMQQARQIGEGNFAIRSLPLRRDELGELASEMNEMAAKLDALTKQVIEQTEHRVATLEQLRHAERLNTIGKLAAGIAHELGTPLNVVAGRSARIAKELAQTPFAESAVVIAEQSDRMADIIRQLLDFARRRTPKKRAFPVHQVCEDTAGLLTSLAKKHGVKIQIERAQNVVCDMDATQVQQVVTNLVINAVQSSAPGAVVTMTVGAEVAVHPETKAQLSCALIRVVDHGCGIPEQDLPHIFEPFFTTKGAGEGTGLGLSVAYGIVSEHGGWIRVSSEVGRGTVFDVFLPRAREAA